MGWSSRNNSSPELVKQFVMAAYNRNLEEVKKCMRKNVNVNAPYSEGFTALHCASQQGYLEVLQYLVQHGKADVNVKNNYIETPLYVASHKGYLEVVQYLLQHGKADVNVQTNDGFTALYVASQNGHLEVVQIGRAHV